jgi:hypothetical protein
VSGRLGLPAWPAIAEDVIVARDVQLARHTGSRVHIAHVSTAASVEIIRWAKAQGIAVTAEVTPHHLALGTDLLTGYDPSSRSTRRCDPTRTERPSWRRSSTVSSMPSPPTTPRTPGTTRSTPSRTRPSGCSVWRRRSPSSTAGGRAAGAAELGQVADRMSVAPARIAGLADQGRPIAVGEPANLVLVDPLGERGPSTGGQPVALAQQPLARAHPARPGRRDVPARRVHGIPRPRPASSTRRRSRESRNVAAQASGAGSAGPGGRSHVPRQSFGAVGETLGEAVFSTGMTGYQETLTDPSYHRQVVVMTAPHVGNTGWNDEDDESRRIWVAGYAVRDPALRPSNWRSARSLEDELVAQGVVGICGIDTRALTRHLRERGAMRVGIFSGARRREPGRPAGQGLAAPGMAGSRVGLRGLDRAGRMSLRPKGNARFTWLRSTSGSRA